ncbi:MAG: NADH-quinone oxidoreductase subunit G [Gammaproteobacteria bacterium]|jgi:NADH-quinone oxidoreductase subunit G
MPTIFVDGQELEVKNGENILEAFLNAGLDLPYFCWHPSMGSIGSCRQCAVLQYQNEEDTVGKIVMGCMTPVADGARFSLNAEKASEFRSAIVESLMLNHPHDCPVCGEGGECHLQDMTVMVGHRDRRYEGPKNTHRNQYLGPLINHEMNRCITCYRCVRYYRDYAGGTDLSAQASHDHTYFGRHQEGTLQSEFSGNLVEVCPTGVFTDKPLLKQYTRKWDLQTAPSICTGCAVGCNISPGERYGKIKRIQNRYNHEVNGYFLCDRGRFGSGYINNSERLNFAALRDGEKPKENSGQNDNVNVERSFSAISQRQGINTATKWIMAASKSGKIAAIGSPRASLEANFLLRELVGKENFSSGFSAQEGVVINRIVTIVSSMATANPSIKEMEGADAILVLGEDITNTAPRVALGLRQSVRNKALELADQARLFHWQDAAVRNLAQDQRSPMVIVSATDTRLDDVASQLISLSPDDIAAFALAVTQSISGEPLSGLFADDDRVKHVAATLKEAKNPLIISGSSMLHNGIVNGALAVATALQTDQSKVMLSYCLPEANSFGLALLDITKNNEETARGRSLDELADNATNIEALIVLENDLPRRMSATQYTKLIDGTSKIIALDVLENNTLESADLVLPSASYMESEGTLISSEGRAQRHYPVMNPLDDRMASWEWLLTLAKTTGNTNVSTMQSFDDVVEACAQSENSLAALSSVAPDHNYRNHGLKVPRQTHRYSGRTAMRADISVHEPQQPIDAETPLAFSMEGLSRDEPAALKSFYWSPGWNSNQAVQKFQAEVDGPLHGGSNGVRLFDPKDNSIAEPAPASSEQTTVHDFEEGKWQLIPIYKVHGSDELSVRTEEISELAGEAFISLGKVVAETLGVRSGDGLLVSSDHNGSKHTLSLEVRLLSRVAKNCVGFSAGFEETLSLQQGDLVSLKKDDNWQRLNPQMIASDRGGRNV